MDYPAEDFHQDLTRIVLRTSVLIAVTDRLVAGSRERLVESRKLLRATEERARLFAGYLGEP